MSEDGQQILTNALELPPMERAELKVNTKNILDFIIIGAQKAGTTTLFKHLSEHPAIYMPLEKEAPFFGHNEPYAKKWDYFLEEFFANAPQDKLWGKATPFYMTRYIVPEYIFQQLPKVKLIAILRDPVARAYSHYKMSVRRGIEKRSFEEAIQTQLRTETLKNSRLNPDESNSYVVWGEYGRILSIYLQYFSREQLLILFTEDLERTPEKVMLAIYDFLGIKPIFPGNLGKRFHQGGLKQRFPHAKQFVKATPLYIIWRAVSHKRKRRIRYWFDQWNTIFDNTNETILSVKTLENLKKHYLADIAILKDIVQSPPWQRFAETKGD